MMFDVEDGEHRRFVSSYERYDNVAKLKKKFC